MADSQNDSKCVQGKIHDYQTQINELEKSQNNNLIAIEVLKARINEVENSRTNLKAKNGQLMNRVSTVFPRIVRQHKKKEINSFLL